LGLLLAAINVQYRDVKYVVPFFTQMMLFVSPVLYPLSYIPARFRTLMGLNPMAGTLEGFRYAILGSPITWPLVWTSMAVSVVLFVVGAHVFRRMERTFADVI
jgi:lipopolysaccharide transport system permease protein